MSVLDELEMRPKNLPLDLDKLNQTVDLENNDTPIITLFHWKISTWDTAGGGNGVNRWFLVSLSTFKKKNCVDLFCWKSSISDLRGLRFTFITVSILLVY